MNRSIFRKFAAVLLTVVLMMTAMVPAYADEVLEGAPRVGTVGMLPPGYTDPRTSGQCGDNINFKFSDDTGVVSVTGSGSTWDYDPSLTNVFTPLNYLDGTLYTIEIGSGITEIKAGFFPESTTLKNVVIPKSVKTIGTSNFYPSNNIKYILYEGTEVEWNHIDIKRGNYFGSAEVLCKGKWFKDVKQGKKYYFNPVYWAVGKKITMGYGEGTFQPDVACNRAMIVTFLYRFAGSPEVTGPENFSDVNSGDWFYDAVRWAVKKGITEGYGEGTFQPYAACNRAMIVTFIKRLWAKDVPVTYSNKFPDIPAGQWYTDSVIWAVNNGITTGMGGYFKPFDPCTRGQAVTFLYRLYRIVTPQ